MYFLPSMFQSDILALLMYLVILMQKSLSSSISSCLSTSMILSLLCRPWTMYCWVDAHSNRIIWALEECFKIMFNALLYWVVQSALLVQYASSFMNFLCQYLIVTCKGSSLLKPHRKVLWYCVTDQVWAQQAHAADVPSDLSAPFDQIKW